MHIWFELVFLNENGFSEILFISPSNGHTYLYKVVYNWFYTSSRERIKRFDTETSSCPKYQTVQDIIVHEKTNKRIHYTLVGPHYVVKVVDQVDRQL